MPLTFLHSLASHRGCHHLTSVGIAPYIIKRESGDSIGLLRQLLFTGVSYSVFFISTEFKIRINFRVAKNDKKKPTDFLSHEFPSRFLAPY